MPEILTKPAIPTIASSPTASGPKPLPPTPTVVTQPKVERKSLLPPELRGVMYVTGMRGVGKSMLAAQADIPDNILFWDFEEKGAGIDAQLHFGKYISVSAEAARQFGFDYKPLQMYDIINQQLKKVEQDRYTVAVVDNLEPLETAFFNQIKKFPLNYGLDIKKVESGAFGGAWPGVNYMVNGFVNHLYSKGIRLVITTAHLKSVWSSTGPIPNKWKPKGVERWHELSILSLVLLTAESAPIPSALVQKEQLASTKFNEETQEIEIVRRLPLRIPKCTFAEIRRYLREPADINKPKAGERPTDEESLPFNDRFSKDQLAYMTAAANAQAAGRQEGDSEPKS